MSDWAAEGRHGPTPEEMRDLTSARADATYFQEWAEFNGRRLNDALAEIERLNGQVERFQGWRAAIYEVARASFRAAGKSRRSAVRYRLAWISARRRAAEEAVLGADAVQHIAADRDRWQRRAEAAEARLLSDD